jgi:hypothetical protein
MNRVLCAACILLSSIPLHAQHWPAFRGENASGVAVSGHPAVAWDVAASRNVRWKVALPGLAHSSPIVWGNQVFVTTSVPLDKAPDELKVGNAGIDAARDMVRHSGACSQSIAPAETWPGRVWPSKLCRGSNGT